MSVAGYNVGEEITDSVVGVELSQEGLAVVYINEESITLTEQELRAFIALCGQTLDELHWAQAAWVYASGISTTDTVHLMHKQSMDKYGKVLCGLLPPSWGTIDELRSWRLSPVVGDPGHDGCKRCYKAYQRLQKTT
jgi:hypothetical protein